MRMISREDLKQRVMGHFCGSCSVPYKDADILELGEYCCDIVSDTMAFIDELPTVEAEPVKHGKWENDKLDIPRCSCCSYIPEFNRHIDDYYYSDFCPNCGARMGGESE